MQNRKHKQSSKELQSKSAKSRLKVVSCVKCHSPKIPGDTHDGIWMCHYYAHHKECSV
jgi:hypothetical protein